MRLVASLGTPGLRLLRSLRTGSVLATSSSQPHARASAGVALPSSSRGLAFEGRSTTPMPRLFAHPGSELPTGSARHPPQAQAEHSWHREPARRLDGCGSLRQGRSRCLGHRRAHGLLARPLDPEQGLAHAGQGEGVVPLDADVAGRITPPSAIRPRASSREGAPLAPVNPWSWSRTSQHLHVRNDGTVSLTPKRLTQVVAYG